MRIIVPLFAFICFNLLFEIFIQIDYVVHSLLSHVVHTEVTRCTVHRSVSNTSFWTLLIVQHVKSRVLFNFHHKYSIWMTCLAWHTTQVHQGREHAYPSRRRWAHCASNKPYRSLRNLLFKMYIGLGLVAARVFTMPVTSCAAERDRTIWGQVHIKTRTNLGLQRAQGLIYVKAVAIVLQTMWRSCRRLA